ncbi:MAG: Tubulin beta chain (Beta tubulin), partial [Paramarteilia canceri]
VSLSPVSLHANESQNENLDKENEGKISVASLSNKPGIADTLNTQVERAEKLLKRGAYLHYYGAEGMDTADINSALESIKDLISEYRDSF